MTEQQLDWVGSEPTSLPTHIRFHKEGTATEVTGCDGTNLEFYVPNGHWHGSLNLVSGLITTEIGTKLLLPYTLIYGGSDDNTN